MKQRLFSYTLGIQILLVSFLSWANASSTSHTVGTSESPILSQMKVILTYKNEVYTGYILRENQTGYLFRTTQNRTLLIPFDQVKDIKSVGGTTPSSKTPVAQQQTPVAPQTSNTTVIQLNNQQQQQQQQQQVTYNNSPTLELQYEQMAKGYAAPILLNLFLPLAIGSWVAGDYVGGTLGLLCQLGSIPLFLLNPFIGMGVSFAGWLIPLISAPITISFYNANLRRRLFANLAPNTVGYRSELPSVASIPAISLSF